MVLLAVDTSGRQGSLALARVTPGRPEIAVLEVVALAGGTFSAQLVPQIAVLLEKHGFRKSDIAGFAVASGPGSFTGLRVGLAAVKALAEILRKPIAAISLLDAVTRTASQRGTVFGVLDAGRGEIYVGEYQAGTFARMGDERLVSKDEFLAEVTGRVVVTSDAGIAEAVRAAGIQVEEVDHPGSDLIARLGWERIQRGETVAPDALEANYMRRSDAEMFAKPKS